MSHVEGTQPYLWPYDGSFDPSRCALVITGAQRAWVDASVGTAAVTDSITAISAALAGRGGTTICVVHHRVAADHPSPFPPIGGSDAAALIDISPTSLVLTARGIDGFTDSALDHTLRSKQITTLVAVGFGAEATVDSTVRSANDRGYECLTVVDAVAPFDHDTGAHALASVTMSGGIFGAIGTTAELLAAINAFPELSTTPSTRSTPS